MMTLTSTVLQHEKMIRLRFFVSVFFRPPSTEKLLRQLRCVFFRLTYYVTYSSVKVIIDDLSSVSFHTAPIAARLKKKEIEGDIFNVREKGLSFLISQLSVTSNSHIVI
jgi:5,10-methylenetetrahydrofolate reductase